MAIYKNANLDISVAAEQNPNYNAKPSVQFSTQDKNTAKYTFTVKQNNKPVDLTGVTASVTLFSEDKSVFQSDAIITSASEGKIEYVIPAEAIRHHGKTRGDLRLTYPNGDVLGGLRFSFNIEQALIDRAAGVVGGVYIRDFEQLKAEIEETVESIKDFDVARVDLELKEKATKQEVQQVTAALAEMPKKGEISVRDIDKNKGKLDQTYMSAELLQQIAGTAPINAVPAEKSITLSQLAFSPLTGKPGKNLFDKTRVTKGKYINQETGELVSGGSANTYSVSDYIEVEPNQTYTRVYGQRLAFFDSSKSYISGVFSNKTVTAPANARYVRFDVLLTNLDTEQFEVGTSNTSYEPFAVLVSADSLKNGSITREKIDSALLEELTSGGGGGDSSLSPFLTTQNEPWEVN